MISQNEFDAYLGIPNKFKHESISILSFDKANSKSMVQSDKYGINFDKYAELFSKKFEVCVPASCDALFRFCEKNMHDEFFLFVEFKNGNILRKQSGNRDNYVLAGNVAKNIRDKLCDSALMLNLGAQLPMQVIHKRFSALVVVNTQKISDDEDVHMELPVNPVESALSIVIANMRLGSRRFVTELIYSSFEIVSRDTFENELVPIIEDPI